MIDKDAMIDINIQLE